ncbi:hypothetical protein G6L37_05530 [Agrobacterium rubi]|nr:hypothetical protein [Agrobacterium rubi]NTF24819.1 hypothetical protein [Agrobacterium rubi]
MSVSQSDLLPALARIGITQEAARDHAIPDAVLEDIAAVAALLPNHSLIPETEVDDDGTAVLRWFSSDMRQSFSLTFLGLGSVGGYLSTDRRDPAWRLSVDDGKRLSARLADVAVQCIVCGRTD